MDFMRAISIVFVVINIYWYCYYAVQEWNLGIEVVNKILLNFDRTAGLFGISFIQNYSSFPCLIVFGHKGVKEEKHGRRFGYFRHWFYPVLYELVDIGFTASFQQQQVFTFLQCPAVISVFNGRAVDADF